MAERTDRTEPKAAESPEMRLGGIPLHSWVVIAAVLAVPVGLVWGEGATRLGVLPAMIIRAATALAAPIVFLAILNAIVTNEIRGPQVARMMAYYLINTVAGIVFGLLMVNVMRPGVGAELIDPADHSASPSRKSLTEVLVESVPRSVGEAFVQNNIIQMVLLALALAIGLARIGDELRARGEGEGEATYRTAIGLLNLGFQLLMRVLRWVVTVLPLAVFGVVAAKVGREGLRIFGSLGWLIAAVVAGMACQVMWYLALMAASAGMSPLRFLRAALDVMATAFSTMSTPATLPVTLDGLTRRLGVSRESSQLAACVGTNFNNDGSALYQATAVLFMAQALGVGNGPADQLIIVATTLLTSVGASAIPSGSIITLPVIFTAVGLPADKIPVLLTVDWFLDRCRAVMNVLGDMTVAVLLDGRSRPAGGEGAAHVLPLGSDVERHAVSE